MKVGNTILSASRKVSALPIETAGIASVDGEFVSLAEAKRSYPKALEDVFSQKEVAVSGQTNPHDVHRYGKWSARHLSCFARESDFINQHSGKLQRGG